MIVYTKSGEELSASEPRLSVPRMMNNKLTTEADWNDNRTFHRETRNHPINLLLHKYVAVTMSGTCIEVGSYPGTWLATLGDLGYELNGIDFNPNNNTRLPLWLKRQGFKCGEFRVADFTGFKAQRTFDVVLSFGFIEHFANYEEMIRKHLELLSPEGLVVITTPNYSGLFQRFLHNWLDKDNARKHYGPSMNPERWASLLREQGFDVLYQGYFGGFCFWYIPHQKRTRFQKVGLWFMTRLVWRLGKLLWFESASFSAHCGIVAKRRKASGG